MVFQLFKSRFNCCINAWEPLCRMHIIVIFLTLYTNNESMVDYYCIKKLSELLIRLRRFEILPVYMYYVNLLKLTETQVIDN